MPLEAKKTYENNNLISNIFYNINIYWWNVYYIKIIIMINILYNYKYKLYIYTHKHLNTSLKIIFS